MRGVGRRSKAGVVVAAGLLTAACAVPTGVQVPDGARYSRVPTSTLVSRRDLQFTLAQVQRGDERTTLLVHEPSQGEAAPVAAISASRTDPLAPVTLRRLSTGADTDLHVATLEHLYSLALHQDAAARF